MYAIQDTNTPPLEPLVAPVANETPAVIVADASGLNVDLAGELERLEHLDWTPALCRDSNPETVETAAQLGLDSIGALFFSDEIPAIRAAKAICAGCELAEDCFTGALMRREPWGVWGGRLFKDGKVLAVKRPRGRPPKDPARQLTA